MELTKLVCLRKYELVTACFWLVSVFNYFWVGLFNHFPHILHVLAGILEKGIHIDGIGVRSFLTYESNVLFALRFMIDCNIVGGNWIEVPQGKYKKAARNLSYCQLEFDCLYPHVWKVYIPKQ